MAEGNWKRQFICSKCGQFIGEEFPDSLYIGQGGYVHVTAQTVLICSKCNYTITWISENEMLAAQLATAQAELAAKGTQVWTIQQQLNSANAAVALTKQQLDKEKADKTAAQTALTNEQTAHGNTKTQLAAVSTELAKYKK